MSLAKLRQVVRLTRATYRTKLTTDFVNRRIRSHRKEANDFDFESFKNTILQYVEGLCIENGSPQYKYSASCGTETLYGSAYALMTRSILGDTKNLHGENRSDWVAYFDSFQDERDGLFYDPVVANEIYRDSDWWGARHLSLHMISAYSAIGARPRCEFRFLEQFYSESSALSWLDGYDWNSGTLGDSDIDNKIMNIGCLLQYQRDAWSDSRAGLATEKLKTFLKGRICPSTGMWGKFDPDNMEARSRMTQFAYHILPIFFYDDDFDFDACTIAKTVLATQNHYGGFGVAANSSACEDIDSIDILVRFYPYVTSDIQSEINSSIYRAFSWVLLNQLEDGGFIFRLNESFYYGADETSSDSNESAALPTWFRTLCIAYMARFLSLENDFHITKSPGYEYP